MLLASHASPVALAHRVSSFSTLHSPCSTPMFESYHSMSNRDQIISMMRQVRSNHMKRKKITPARPPLLLHLLLLLLSWLLVSLTALNERCPMLLRAVWCEAA